MLYYKKEVWLSEKELAKKKKAEEKKQSKLDKKNIQARADSEQASNEGVTVV